MYNEYFGFEETPFSIAPDPRYLYMSEQHREALAHLMYGFNSDGGFVLLTGEVGTGKTTVCRCLLDKIPKSAVIAFIFNPKLSAEELLASICDEFGIKYPEGNTSTKVFIDLINEFLLSAHANDRRAILIVDEAQNLSPDVLEQLRLLTNLETSKIKLLQVILLGQPELRAKLQRTDLRQLSQRIIARYHLGPLSQKDVGAYVAHRLAIAGLKRQLFPPDTIRKIYRLSNGVPRIINVLCDRALLGTFAQGKNEVSIPILKKAAKEVFGKSDDDVNYRPAIAWTLTILSLIVIGAVLASTYYSGEQVTETPSQNKAAVISETPLPVPDPPKLDSLAWPDGLSREQSSFMAYRAVFKLWNIDFTSEEKYAACTYANIHGVMCMYSQGNLRGLLLLNRPAVLKLYNENGWEYYAALTGVQNETATLVVGEEILKVDIKEIEAHWFGDYILIWRPPPDYRETVKPGHEGMIVQWIERQLSVINNRTSGIQYKYVYDNTFADEIRKFQLSRGLVPDGIVGVKTLILLNSAAGIEAPVLQSNTG